MRCWFSWAEKPILTSGATKTPPHLKAAAATVSSRKLHTPHSLWLYSWNVACTITPAQVDRLGFIFTFKDFQLSTRLVCCRSLGLLKGFANWMLHKWFEQILSFHMVFHILCFYSPAGVTALVGFWNSTWPSASHRPLATRTGTWQRLEGRAQHPLGFGRLWHCLYYLYCLGVPENVNDFAWLCFKQPNKWLQNLHLTTRGWLPWLSWDSFWSSRW